MLPLSSSTSGLQGALSAGTFPHNNDEIMSETLPASQPTDSNLQAANDLRAAASGKAREIAHTAEDKARLLKESAAEKAKELKEVAAVRSKEIREVASERSVQFRDHAGENVQHLKSAASEQWQGTRLKLREFHADTEGLVRQHPTQTILAAAAIGFVVGLVVRR